MSRTQRPMVFSARPAEGMPSIRWPSWRDGRPLSYRSTITAHAIRWHRIRAMLAVPTGLIVLVGCVYFSVMLGKATWNGDIVRFFFNVWPFAVLIVAIGAILHTFRAIIAQSRLAVGCGKLRGTRAAAKNHREWRKKWLAFEHSASGFVEKLRDPQELAASLYEHLGSNQLVPEPPIHRDIALECEHKFTVSISPELSAISGSDQLERLFRGVLLHALCSWQATAGGAFTGFVDGSTVHVRMLDDTTQFWVVIDTAFTGKTWNCRVRSGIMGWIDEGYIGEQKVAYRGDLHWIRLRSKYYCFPGNGYYLPRTPIEWAEDYLVFPLFFITWPIAYGRMAMMHAREVDAVRFLDRWDPEHGDLSEMVAVVTLRADLSLPDIVDSKRIPLTVVEARQTVSELVNKSALLAVKFIKGQR